MDANMLLSWHKYGGGKELLEKLYARSAPTSCRSLRADADPAARLVQEADHQGEDFKG
jgi:TRAP-type mannitol/chloroaromatic compound transport system substrate-binding protein